MKYIYVLDFTQGKIFEIVTYQLSPDGSNIEEVLSWYGLSESSCQWMICDEKRVIEEIQVVD